jgi:2-dehydropantoate 2-reductase
VSEQVKIAVYGTGGVGGYFGGKLAQAGADVSLIARGPHLERLRRDGLKVRGALGDFSLRLAATDDPAEIGPCDYVLFCVKSYDTDDAAKGLAPLVGPETAVVSLQNGMDNEERIAAHVGWEHVMAGVSYIYAHISEPGIIQARGLGKVVFGELDAPTSDRGTRLLELFLKSGTDAELSGNIREAMWRKYTFILALSGMTAAARVPIGVIRSTPETWSMFRAIIEEAIALARAEGVELPEDTLERHLQFAHKLDANGYSSLHHDLVQGKRLELDALHGHAVRLGDRHGVPVPMCEAVYAVLRPWAAGSTT